MPSLSDLAGVYAPSGPESGFLLAGIEQQRNEAVSGAGVSRERILRNYNRFDLPSMLSSQAARGAFNSSATENKQLRLATGAGDSLADVAMGLANTESRLASDALLAKTGVRVGGY